ncbi:sucrose-phosphatase-like HAD superfamily hydrolase [Cryptosporidium sp. chipmunk genotype I]|uniref:sucrose-phosphatase-like HAD superfamily hydrolase n=1 Tax=Cryptosporidium sp. chipmunk genotype I TaxID=1280935 RepID=UPI00351AA93D|nr:sucrose-phosphatase-like HAD superfamily hydrolase [Cryptosporidium sp. chipmunk genotype I]
MVRVQLFYNSAWERVFFYSDEQENLFDGEQKWVFREMRPVEQILDWHTVELETKRAFLEFVLCNTEKTEWDNPPSSYCRKNYFISIKDAERESGKEAKKGLKFCLKDGDLSHIVPRSPIVVVTDLDGTLIGHDDYLKKFNEIWIRQHMFNGSKLIYSTGRNLKDFLLAAKQFDLLRPDYAICGVGTEIYEFPNKEMDLDTFCQKLSTTIGRKVVQEELFSLLRFQDRGEYVEPKEGDKERVAKDVNPSFPIWCKNRFYAWPVDKWLQMIRKTFKREELKKEVQESLNKISLEYYINGNNFHDPFRLSVSINTEYALKVYEEIQINKKSYRFAISGQGAWKYLDVLPDKGGKHLSIIFLYEEILEKSIPLERFLVCGDSGNDAHMFTIESCKNCCVGNAQQDLKDFLLGSCRESSDEAESRQVLSSQSELLCRIMSSQNLKPPKKVFISMLPNAGGIIQALIHNDFITYNIDSPIS